MPIRAQFPQPNSDSALLANPSSILKIILRRGSLCSGIRIPFLELQRMWLLKWGLIPKSMMWVNWNESSKRDLMGEIFQVLVYDMRVEIDGKQDVNLFFRCVRLCCWMHFQRRGLFSVFWLYGLAIFIDENYTRVNVPVKPPFCECCALAIFTCWLLTLVNAATLLNFQFGSRRVETPECSVFGLLPSVWLRRGDQLRLYELNTQHLRLAHRPERDK